MGSSWNGFLNGWSRVVDGFLGPQGMADVVLIDVQVYVSCVCVEKRRQIDFGEWQGGSLSDNKDLK